MIPLVSVDKEKLLDPRIIQQLQAQANRYGKTIRFGRFFFSEEFLNLPPAGTTDPEGEVNYFCPLCHHMSHNNTGDRCCPKCGGTHRTLEEILEPGEHCDNLANWLFRLRQFSEEPGVHKTGTDRTLP